MASYDMEMFSGMTMTQAAAYLNRMNEKLRYVLHHLDEDNMTDAYCRNASAGNAASGNTAASALKKRVDALEKRVDALDGGADAS